MAGVECLLCCFDHRLYGNLTYNNFNLYLGKESCVSLYSSVVFAGTLLYTASHYLCNSHSGHSQIVHCLAQSVIPCKLCYDNHFVDSGIKLLHSVKHRNCSFSLSFGGFGIIRCSEICVLVYAHFKCVGYIHDRESRICGSKTVLCCIETGDFFLFLHP